MQTTTQSRILKRRDLQSLLNQEGSPCLSVFLPTHRAGREQLPHELRLMHLVARAEQRLHEEGFAAGERKPLLEPLQELLADAELWQHPSDGLAIFRSPSLVRAYRLPVSFAEQVVIGERFQILPLLPLLHAGGRFFVLALSQESARLFEATRDAMHELELPEFTHAPGVGWEHSLPRHLPRRGARGISSAAITHRQGGREDRSKSEMLNFFHRVNDAVRRVLQGEDAALVLACVGYLAPIYETANSYPSLIRAKVPGNPNMWTDEELRERAWRLVEPQFEQQRQASLAAVREDAGKGLVLTGLHEAVVAAQRGRIQTLLLRRGAQQGEPAGSRHEALQEATAECRSAHLLNDAAAETLQHGGKVFLVDDIPHTDSPLAAIARC